MNKSLIYKGIYKNLSESTNLIKSDEDDIEFGKSSPMSVEKQISKYAPEMLGHYTAELDKVNKMIDDLTKLKEKLTSIIDKIQMANNKQKNPDWGVDLSIWPIKYKGVIINDRPGMGTPSTRNDIYDFSRTPIKKMIDDILYLIDIFGSTIFNEVSLWYSGYTGADFIYNNKLIFTILYMGSYISKIAGSNMKQSNNMNDVVSYIKNNFGSNE